MKNTYYLLLSLMFSNFIYSQVDFGEQNTYITNQHTPSQQGVLTTLDIDNDGYPEVFSINGAENGTLAYYKNINGNIKYEQLHIISNVLNPRRLIATDIDNDGLTDILVTSQITGKIVWFKNFGDFTFSEEIVIATLPLVNSIVVSDINNDGKNDIIASSDTSVVTYLNSSNIIFTINQIIEIDYYHYNMSLIDIDNDGDKDLFSIYIDTIVFFRNNNGIFENGDYIGYTSGKSALQFYDVNNDGFYDMFAASGSNIKLYTNNNGEYFEPSQTLLSTTLELESIQITDIDGDNEKDILAGSFDTIGWFKNVSIDGEISFDDYAEIGTDLHLLNSFITEDINNNGYKEILAASYLSTEKPKKKATYFEHNSNGTFDEIIFNMSIGALWNNKIVDIDNDGLNDIVTGASTVIWSKNRGNGIFSVPLFVSGYNNNAYAYRIETSDLNNDGYTDIIAIQNSLLEVYENEGNGTFTLQYSITSSSSANSDIKVADFDGNGFNDIVFIISGSGTSHVGLIKNLGNFAFDELLNIQPSYYYPNKIACGDIDNDGDVDMAVSSSEISTIQWLENNGSGTFTIHNVYSETVAGLIDLVDIDNDGWLDIISGGPYWAGSSLIYWLRNNNLDFNVKKYISGTSRMQSIVFKDLNNDGDKDFIGIYETAYLGDDVLAYYLKNGNSYTKTIVDTVLNDTTSTDLQVNDINNDGKDDLLAGLFITGKNVIYYNQSLLFNDPPKLNTNKNIFYPNPVSSSLNIKIPGIYEFAIYNELGQIAMRQNNCSEQKVDLSGLKEGLYIIKVETNNQTMVEKIIIQH